MARKQPLSPQEHYARRGKMIAGAGMIIRDERGRVLLVHTTYGDRLWEIPGGGLEPGEHPEDAAVREVAEEIGLDLAPGLLLAIDLVPCMLLDGQAALLANWVFDGGVLDDLASVRPDLVEIDETRFCGPAEYRRLLPGHMARRVDACLDARAAGANRDLREGRLAFGLPASASFVRTFVSLPVNRCGGRTRGQRR